MDYVCLRTHAHKLECFELHLSALSGVNVCMCSYLECAFIKVCMSGVQSHANVVCHMLSCVCVRLLYVCVCLFITLCTHNTYVHAAVHVCIRDSQEPLML